MDFCLPRCYKQGRRTGVVIAMLVQRTSSSGVMSVSLEYRVAVSKRGISGAITTTVLRWRNAL